MMRSRRAGVCLPLHQTMTSAGKRLPDGPRRAGFSLVEVVVATMVTGVVLVGSLNALGGVMKTRREAGEADVGALLADQLVAEILALPFKDPQDPTAGIGPDAGESGGKRNGFDDIDDYHNFNASPPQDKQGAALPYAGWTQNVKVYWAERLNGNIWPLYETGLVRIEVRITSPSSVETRRFVLRWKEGALEQPPPTDLTVVTKIDAKLRIGAQQTAAQTGVNLVNPIADPVTP